MLCKALGLIIALRCAVLLLLMFRAVGSFSCNAAERVSRSYLWVGEGARLTAVINALWF